MASNAENAITVGDIRQKYEGFTKGLALFDLAPVLLFGLTAIVIGTRFPNSLFLTGAVSALAGGLCKVLWKFLIAVADRDLHFLNRPLFIVLMPAGFSLMLVSVLISFRKIRWQAVGQRMISFPALLFFILGATGLAAMVVFVHVHDKTIAKNNWVEQATNTFAQAMILLGVLCC